jgi:predicted amidophosphoribosyltransferase
MICPNCGADMERIEEEWVCPECEYHTEKRRPARGSFR